MGKEMGSTLVCVRRVKQEAAEEWDESMPLPGDIIEGFSADDSDERFIPTKAKSELRSQLGKISQKVDTIWLKVRRGESTIKLRARITPERSSVLQRKFTIKSATDDRHVVVLGDLTLEQCTELQEMSRRVVNMDCRTFNQTGVKYDWKMKVGTYLPDRRSTVVSSILFMPMEGEYCIEAITTRCMAWLSAAISSGVPLVFVNIQSEQSQEHKINLFSNFFVPEKTQLAKESTKGGRQNQNTIASTVQAIRLWFLPGIAEVLLEMTLEPGEARFGIDIKRTDEGFICVFSVTKDSAADRAGLGLLCEEAHKAGHLLVISRLEGKSLMPSSVCSDGLINCCDHNEIKGTLTSAIEQMDPIHVHFMAWPTAPNSTNAIGVSTLLPPNSL